MKNPVTNKNSEIRCDKKRYDKKTYNKSALSKRRLLKNGLRKKRIEATWKPTDIELEMLSHVQRALFYNPTENTDEVCHKQKKMPISNEAYTEMKKHGIHTLCMEGMNEKQKHSSARYLVNNIQILYIQNQLVSCLQKNAIPAVILKGTSNAVYYPYPLYRNSGDIDIWVKEDRYEEAFRLLIAQGYQCENELLTKDSEITKVLQKQKKHSEFSYCGCQIELHRIPVRVEDYTNINFEQILITYMEKGVIAPGYATLDTYTFPVLPPKQAMLEHLIHVQQHLRNGGIGLRQILDWEMFVKAEITDASYPAYQKILQKFGLETFASILTRMCQLYIGLPEKGYTWAAIADDRLAGRLMERILRDGNFGRANVKSDAERVFSRSLFLKVKSLQSGGISQHSAIFDKHPWLMPFAWMFQLNRYAKYFKLHYKEVFQEYKKGKRQRQFIDDFEIFKV